MLYKPISQPITRPVAFLYAVVFNSGYSVCIILLLLLSFTVQPIHQAYASEPVESTEEVETTPTAEPVREHTDTKPAESNEPLLSEAEESTDTETKAAQETTVAETEGEKNETTEDKKVNELETNQRTDEGDISSADETEEHDNSDDFATNASNTSAAAASVTNDETEAITTDGANGGVTATTTQVTSTTTATGTEANLGEVAGASTTTTGTSTDTATTSEGNVITTMSTMSAVTASTTATSSTDAGDETGTDADGSSGTNDSGDTDEKAEQGPVQTSESTTETEDNSSTDAGAGTSNDQSADESSEDATTQTVSSSTVDGKYVATESVEYLVTEKNYYQFSKQSCVSVGDGAYHCSANDEPVVDSKAVVYSEMGPNKNQEIYIRTAKGDVKQLTDNAFEDSAPHYDPESQQIVWQRLIDGRYQVIVYNITDNEEVQLTFSRNNSMEPAVSGAGVVWQSWDGNDWEIMFFDGTYTDQLTDNGTQEISPVLEDEYIIWTVIGADSQYAQVYDLVTKETMTIVNHEGGSIVNPRFVLVYDTQFDNGDVITQGFDPETGFSAPIAAKSGPEPVDIPDSDSTGETRALIQNKSTSKESGEVKTKSASSSLETGESVVTAEANDSTALDLSRVGSTTDATVASSSETVVDDSVDDAVATTTESVAQESYLELSEYDLILPTSTTPVATGHEPGNVITATSSQDEHR